MLMTADGFLPRRDASFPLGAWINRARRSLKLADSNADNGSIRVPLIVAGVILTVLLSVAGYAFQQALTAVANSSTQGLSTISRQMELSTQLVEQRAMSQLVQERVLRESLQAQMRDRDAEHDRQIREMANQVAALTLANSETRGVLNNLQALVTELRDAVVRLPLREIPQGRDRRSQLDGGPDLSGDPLPFSVVTAP